MAGKEKKPKTGLIIFIVLLIAGAGFLYWQYYLKPALAEISILREEQHELRYEIDALRTKLGRKPEIEQKWDSIREQEPYYFAKIPKLADLPQVLGALEHLVLSSPLEVETLTATAFQQAEQSGFIPVSLKVKGPVEELLRLQEKLEQFKHLTLTAKAIIENLGDNHQLSLDFVFIFLPEGQVGPVGSGGKS